MSTSLNKYSSFVKLEHTLFSLPLLFAGALLANNEWPSLRVTLLIVLAGGAARAIALVLNRVIDRRIDAKNPRTAERHLSSGKMKVSEAWMIGLVGLVIYLFCAWLLSDFCLKLSWIPLVGFTAYPYFKRITKWTHVGLGIVWAMVPLSGFFAVKPSLDGIAPVAILCVFSIFWLAGFDIIYATLDEEFDREAGVNSLPSAWGAERALNLAGIFHVLAFVLLIVLYGVWLSGPITVMLLAAIGVLLYVEYRMSSNVDVAFFQINTLIGFLVLFMVITGLKGV